MKKVVVVDDSRIDRLIIKNALESNDIEAVTVGDPESAIQIIEQVMPDAIILDVNLQDGVTGFDLIADIKKHVPIKSIPVIFVSSSRTADEQEQAHISMWTA